MDFLPRRAVVEVDPLFVFTVVLWVVWEADVDFEAGFEVVEDLCVVVVFGLLELVLLVVESV